jgi:hypothetical protein
MEMERVKRADALAKREFHERLRRWIENTDDHVIKPDVLPPTAWVHVRNGSDVFILHADTPRDAVSRYLQLVSSYGDGIEWHITTGQRGNRTSALFGPDRVAVKSFYLYRPLKKKV